MDIKLTNGKKIIVKEKKYYEANLAHFTRNGFSPLNEKKTKKDNVVKLKTKAKHGKTKKSSSKSKKKT